MSKELTYTDGDKIVLNKELADECGRWSIYVNGKTRAAALEYLDGEVTRMNSDGVACDFIAGGYAFIGGGNAAGYFRRLDDDPETGEPRFEYVAAAPDGSCICARLLMMLHDISEGEATRQMFLRLQELRGREVRGRVQ